ncbi:LTA synthase family protein [Pendulispora albinea]|uniref:Sulfatase-like hydrolase/transferase n=1 Tax=Pendulispora albinea TaxID=2741071 RepID=A0ABZ2M7R3_9BACT
MVGPRLGRVRAWVRAWIPTSFWIAAFVQTVFLIALAASDGYDVARSGEGLRVVLTYATVFALFGPIHLLVRSQRWAWRITALVYVLFVAFHFAHFETTGSFDYGFVHANVRELATPLGRRIVLANVRPWEIAVFLLVPLTFMAAFMRWPARPWRGTERARRVALGVYALLLIGAPMARIRTHEPLTDFAISAFRFHAVRRAAAATLPGAEFPLVHESIPSARARAIAGVGAAAGAAADGARPHVLLLFLESWSAQYADKARPDGRKFTPFFDQWRREGLTFDHFYGNSVQSSRGHFATLCSMIPMVHAKEFVDIPNTRVHCLPKVLGEHGYATSFHSASDEPDFDSAAKYLTQIGFDDVRFAQEHTVSQDPAFWGVGLQDDVFYERFFESLDAKVAREPGKPQFAVLANASHHYPFDKNPKHVPDPEDDGKSSKYRRNYTASLTAADTWLNTFFEALDRRPAFRDAIVILVGDHSFPADEHGIHFNGLGSFEEAFRIGFALHWRGHVAPHVITDRAASQIDLAPTIVDLLQIRAPTHFAGRSLVADDDPRPPVPLVQPYDGVQLAAVQWPFKLAVHESAEQEHLYNLAQDPDEENDLMGQEAFAREVATLRQTIVRIHASEALLLADRVWPLHP